MFGRTQHIMWEPACGGGQRDRVHLSGARSQGPVSVKVLDSLRVILMDLSEDLANLHIHHESNF